MRIQYRARTLGALALIGILVIGAAGCGGDDAGSGGCDVAVSTEMNKKPSITIPDCATKPTQLQTKDVVEGTGEAAKEGAAVSVQYVGVSWSTKEQFDASWDRGGQAYTVQPLGQAGVIEGWNKGLVGVKVGGRRLLVIPPDLGYGPGGQGPIKPNETLVFVIDVVSIG